MGTHETQRDYRRLVRPMETHETQRDYWILVRRMGIRETQRDQWGIMTSERLLVTHETIGDS